MRVLSLAARLTSGEVDLAVPASLSPASSWRAGLLFQ